MNTYTTEQLTALKDLLYRIADDALVIGHRNSEWTGFGPVLEEDIAFASLAQNEIGQAQSYYYLLHELGEDEPDTIAFLRAANAFKNCVFTELPIGDYAFSLIRHFLYDYAKEIRLRALVQSSYAPLANLAAKIQREQKYHLLHARTWIIQLGQGTEESRLRMQTALREAFPAALGIFEPTNTDSSLVEAAIQDAENVLASRWLEAIQPILKEAGLQLPDTSNYNVSDYYGGRKGIHTEHLDQLLQEMTVVLRSDPLAKW